MCNFPDCTLHEGVVHSRFGNKLVDTVSVLLCIVFKKMCVSLNFVFVCWRVGGAGLICGLKLLNTFAFKCRQVSVFTGQGFISLAVRVMHVLFRLPTQVWQQDLKETGGNFVNHSTPTKLVS